MSVAFRNTALIAMEQRGRWQRIFITAYMAVIAERAAKIAVEQFEKCGAIMDPETLARAMAREAILGEKIVRVGDPAEG